MKQSLADTFDLKDSFYDCDVSRVGLWMPGNRKIGFIGIQTQKWLVSHGFSLNLRVSSLNGFQGIDPCGLKDQNVLITCVEQETGKPISNEDFELFRDSIISNFTKLMGYDNLI